MEREREECRLQKEDLEKEKLVRGPGKGVENQATRRQYPDEERICWVPGADE